MGSNAQSKINRRITGSGNVNGDNKQGQVVESVGRGMPVLPGVCWALCVGACMQKPPKKVCLHAVAGVSPPACLLPLSAARQACA